MYYARVLERTVASGKVEFHPNCEYLGERGIVSNVSGERFEAPEGCRIVDARYLAPSISAEKPPPFGVTDDAWVVPVNDLARLEVAPSQYVVVGSGKTATDACIWLLSRGVDPDAICWVRPRDAWMMNRAVVQPDPAVFLGMAADTMQAAEGGRLARGPGPSAGGRRHHAQHRSHGRADDGQDADPGDLGAGAAPHAPERRATGAPRDDRPREAPLRRRIRRRRGRRTRRALRADGLKYPHLVPVWRPEAITLQPIRAGFPCFGAALVGYVEATRADDAEKNRLCPPSPYGNSMAEWARMNVLGTPAAISYSAEPDIMEWAPGGTQPGPGSRRGTRSPPT